VGKFRYYEIMKIFTLFNKIITLNGKLEIVGGKKLWKTNIVIL
jgi:hypothetical protein